MGRREVFGKEVSKLFGGNIGELKKPCKHFFSSEVAIDNYVFGSFMLNGVMSNVYGGLVVTKKGHRLKVGHTQFCQ